MTDEPTHAEALQTAAETVAADVAHDAERDTRHGLAHLETEFVAEIRKITLWTEEEAKKLLAWVAGKL